jgi:hypothetical protein
MTKTITNLSYLPLPILGWDRADKRRTDNDQKATITRRETKEEDKANNSSNVDDSFIRVA